MAAGGYRKGTGPKSTLAKKLPTPKKEPTDAPSVEERFQARAQQHFDQIMATWEAKAFGTLIAVYDLKELKGKKIEGEVSGGVDQHGVPVYVYKKEPERQALEFISAHLLGKPGTKQQDQVDNVFVLNHQIPRPVYGSAPEPEAAPPPAEAPPDPSPFEIPDLK